MGILSGIVSYLFGLALNLLDAAINGFLGALGFDLGTFEQYFPAAADFHDVMIGFAVGLLFIMLVFQVFRNFGVVLDIEAEDPMKMLGKTALFLGMILYSRSIIDLILALMADPYAIFLNAAPAPYQFELSTLVTAIFNSTFSNPFMNIVSVILMLVMGWQFLKLTVECVERYIVFYFALYCAPVVFATGAFKSTAQILKSWCRMVGSQAMLLLINIWSIKLFLSYMPVFEQSGNDMIFTFLIGYAFLKFAQKADTLLRILGLNTASTGDMVRSLGGTIAGIAMTIRSIGHLAPGVASAVGQKFHGASSSNGKIGESGRENQGGSGDGISGMGGRREGSPFGGVPERKDTADEGGITMSGISAAKQGFVTDVMRAARVKMEGGPFVSTEAGLSGDAEDSTEGRNHGQPDGAEPQSGKIPMYQGENSKSSPNSFRNLDEETLEGLSNLAHGLPHDKFDPERKTFSGGGFPKFTGEEANLIGASQLMPADGIERSVVKRADGTVGTVYRNEETGEAHMVQFSSVDNGVMQGTISKIDPATGKAEESFDFKAVHNSVPGAETFSGHSVPVREPSGGAYHLSTGASTAIFSAAQGSTIPTASSSYTPGGINKMGVGQEKSLAGKGAENAGGQVPPALMVETDLGGSARPSESGIDDIALGKAAASIPREQSTAPGAEYTGGAAPLASEVQGMTESVYTTDETMISVQKNEESPFGATGMKPPQNRIRRFSKNNPANLEVFRRDSSRLEAFEKQKPDLGPDPGVTPLKK